MPDILIRDVSADDLAAIDALAKRVGLTRSEYLRRRLRTDARRINSQVTPQDLDLLSALAADLKDPEVMGAAWS